MGTKLVIATGKSAGKAIAVKREKLLIGRAEECDIRPLSDEVSRRHCAVRIEPGVVWVEDLGSRNGTFVNGHRIAEKTKVYDDDLIKVGALELRVAGGTARAAAAQTSWFQPPSGTGPTRNSTAPRSVMGRFSVVRGGIVKFTATSDSTCCARRSWTGLGMFSAGGRGSPT